MAKFLYRLDNTASQLDKHVMRREREQEAGERHRLIDRFRRLLTLNSFIPVSLRQRIFFIAIGPSALVAKALSLLPTNNNIVISPLPAHPPYHRKTQ
ncbi:sulfite reductase beta subunit [Pseudozyma hubeiensis SY62]|uniref:Sulfite reductase beta subunit n=1 Tax=Pseudozyma hubeiensis (strain SY62) TaxID=1305764 RepID=R9PIS1_PSEHS|nr:sulfite reductase beta subunit [Pseudozyma hubeiensis SY62]GAC98005.1 sulfite reductase beta subunit [Pseudozyma hubeiensis SY62]